MPIPLSLCAIRPGAAISALVPPVWRPQWQWHERALRTRCARSASPDLSLQLGDERAKPLINAFAMGKCIANPASFLLMFGDRVDKRAAEEFAANEPLFEEIEERQNLLGGSAPDEVP